MAPSAISLCSAPDTSLSLPTHRPLLTILHLPPELHLLIFSHLPWPDLLALKHTHPYFYHNIPTTVRQRVTWLLSRAPCGLGFPQEKVNTKTDTDFCRSREIRTFLERRRWHLDCHWYRKHCLIFEGQGCPEHVRGGAKGKRVMPWKERRLWWVDGKGLPSSWGLLWMLGLLMAVLVTLIANNSLATADRNSQSKLWPSGFT
jgi:hypothetical protein